MLFVYPLIIKNGMNLMNILLYVMIFITGSVFGSFFSLAVYRLPRKENITYVRSHCTTCNHSLYFIDLIPIFSYIFLGGKCRYCKDKIRSRYILLEIFSGLVFLVIALSQKITVFSTIPEFINLFFIYLFICALFIIGGIDKEKYIIHDGTLIYGIVVALLYGLYNAFFGKTMIYNLYGFLVLPIAFTIINLLFIKLKEENHLIGFGDVKYIALIGLFLGFGMQVITLIFATIIAVIYALIKKEKEIPLGYFLSIAAVIVIILTSKITLVANLINITMI